MRDQRYGRFTPHGATNGAPAGRALRDHQRHAAWHAGGGAPRRPTARRPAHRTVQRSTLPSRDRRSTPCYPPAGRACSVAPREQLGADSASTRRWPGPTARACERTPDRRRPAGALAPAALSLPGRRGGRGRPGGAAGAHRPGPATPAGAHRPAPVATVRGGALAGPDAGLRRGAGAGGGGPLRHHRAPAPGRGRPGQGGGRAAAAGSRDLGEGGGRRGPLRGLLHPPAGPLQVHPHLTPWSSSWRRTTSATSCAG